MISNLARLKKMMVDKPWLYEEEEHAVLKLAEDAVALLQELSATTDGNFHMVKEWLEEHK